MSTGLVEALGELVAPLVEAGQDPSALERLLVDLGVEVSLGEVVEAFDEINSVLGLGPTINDAIDALSRLDEDPIAALADLVAAIDQIWTLVADLGSMAVSVDLPAVFAEPETWPRIAARLPGQLIGEWLDAVSPPAAGLLLLTGVLSSERWDGASPAGFTFHPDVLASLVTDPIDTIVGAIGWGDELAAEATLTALGRLLAGAGSVGWVAVPEPVVEGHYEGHPPDPLRARSLEVALPLGMALRLSPLPVDSEFRPGTGFDGFHASLDLPLGPFSLAIGPDVLLSLSGPEEALEGSGLILRPDGLSFDTPDAVELSALLEWVPELPARLIGATGASGVELGAIAVGFGADLRSGSPDLWGLVDVRGLRVSTSEDDLGSIIAMVLGGGIDVDVDVSLRLDSGGLSLNGTVGLRIIVAPQITIGPLQLLDVELEVAAVSDGLLVVLRSNVVLHLGPVEIVVDGLGLGTTLVLADGRPPQFLLAPEAPTGAGVALDLGVVSGGGYLSIDADTGTYQGAIALEVMSIGISAFVLIETERPDIDGWSVLMALYLDLPAIQLGFGFALTGVGGLAGINRSIDEDGLGAAVRSGSLDTVLFPDDPIADAPVVIDTLASMFPAAPDRYVFGPVVRISWGTPSVVDVSLGVVIELPDPIRIAVLGSVSAVLPDPAANLVAFNLDVSGFVDFEAGTLSIDASLHHSHVIGFSLAGDMALRATFIGQPTFLFSLGGFHPGFRPPAGFPTLRRLSLGLDGGEILSISFECYFAITANTVQFGAAFHLSANVAGFGIEGGASFDALIYFSPFLLTTSVGFYISVKAAGIDLMGVWLGGDLSGPNPWRIKGFARFKILGLEHEIDLDETIGNRELEADVEAPDLMAMIREALDDDDAWAVDRSEDEGVVLARALGVGDTGRLVANPASTVEAIQNVAPIDTQIEKYGNALSLDHIRFDLERAGEPAVPWDGDLADNWFAPGHLYDLGPNEELTAPSFEAMPAGVRLGGRVTAGAGRETTLLHEEAYVDPEFEEARGDSDGPVPTYHGAADRRRAGLTEFGPRSQLGAEVSAHSYQVVDHTYDLVDVETGEVTDEGLSYGRAHLGRNSRSVPVRSFELEGA